MTMSNCDHRFESRRGNGLSPPEQNLLLYPLYVQIFRQDPVRRPAHEKEQALYESGSIGDFPDPVWLWDTGYGIKDAQCNFHWIEAVVGVDAKIFGPLHLGWSIRYKRRIAHKEGEFEKTWYVPGFGIYGDTRLGGTFNVIIDI